MNSRKGKTDLMIKYIPLLLWILVLYFMSWSYTSFRTESVLITTGKNLSKILFFINSSHGISIVSIIIGLFAHFSLMIFVVLLFFNDIVQLYVELILRFWWLSGISLLTIGEIIETYIKFKRAETPKKRISGTNDYSDLFSRIYTLHYCYIWLGAIHISISITYLAYKS
ncbi:MAG: hypothetical protein HDQ96_00435 [Lachnospiraceae bacterium]|nr:hypothetical protein [Lachnospiraceae bacterium]